MKRYIFITLVLITLIYLTGKACSHGTVIDPMSRASRWRFDKTAVPDWNDKQSWCGGVEEQWHKHGGKCGICGDNYSDPRPREHELGGIYGDGKIVKTFESGSDITIQLKISSNHYGYSRFDLCNMDPLKAKGAITEEEECFDEKVLTAKGEEKWYFPVHQTKIYEIDLKLPKITCNHCVFRWTWRTGKFNILINNFSKLFKYFFMCREQLECMSKWHNDTRMWRSRVFSFLFRHIYSK